MTPTSTALHLPGAIVGTTAGPLSHDIDARWLMAYAAALGEEDPRYYDTATAAGPLAHPLFPVCYEWPLAVELRARAISEVVAALGVHATHQLTIHRLPRRGDRLSTAARIVSVNRRRAGALVIVRFDTTDARGEPVSTTLHGSLYRGVETDAAAGTRVDDGGRASDGPIRWEAPVPVAAKAAHLYTECARIWNPIHTDGAVARAAGLPGPILHGTATLALGVSRVVARDLGGEPARVRGVSARFTGMVPVPSRFVVRGRAGGTSAIEFDAVDAGGRPVLSDGTLTL